MSDSNSLGEGKGAPTKAIIKSVDSESPPNTSSDLHPPASCFAARARPRLQLEMETTKSLADTCVVSEEMQTRVIEICAGALDKYNVEKDVAMYIKKEFDRLYGTTWHCVVGKKCVMSS